MVDLDRPLGRRKQVASTIWRVEADLALGLDDSVVDVGGDEEDQTNVDVDVRAGVAVSGQALLDRGYCSSRAACGHWRDSGCGRGETSGSACRT